MEKYTEINSIDIKETENGFEICGKNKNEIIFTENVRYIIIQEETGPVGWEGSGTISVGSDDRYNPKQEYFVITIEDHGVANIDTE